MPHLGIIGRLPGLLEEIRYHRWPGSKSGWYKHPFRTPSRIYGLSDGGLYIKPLRRGAGPLFTPEQGGWLENAPGCTGGMRRHSLNELLALYNRPRGKGGHMAKHHKHHRHHRHNPDVMTAAWRRPGSFAMEAVATLGGAYGVVTIGNWVGTFVPSIIAGSGYMGTDMTSKLIRLGVRGLTGWGLDRFVAGSLGPSNRSAFRVGIVLGVGASALLDFLNSSFSMGVGDVAQTPMGILRNVGLAGVDAYSQVPMRGVRGLDAYSQIALRSVRGVGRGPGIANRLYPVNMY